MDSEKQIKNKTFFESLINYYSEFLSTNFKKTRLPKRQINKKDIKGKLVGIKINIYKNLLNKFYDQFDKPINEGIKLKIKRGLYQSELPKSVIDLILKQIDSVNLEDITRITNESIEHFDKILEKDKIDIEIEFENIVETIRKKVEIYCITKFVNN